MSRHKLRIKAMAAVYSYLVMERDIDELITEAFDTPQGLIGECADAKADDGYEFVDPDAYHGIEEDHPEIPDSEEDIEYFRNVVETACNNVERYAGYIDNVMESWSFNRLGFLEKTVLLNGCAEFDLRQVQAAVIIDEAVRLAKAYCEEKSYRIINKVLQII